jgi:hypothetical protein
MTEESDLVVFNQFEDVLISLELAANLLATDQRSTVLCKWLIVSIQDALQCAMMCALSATQVTDHLARSIDRELGEANKRDYPVLRIDVFTELFKRVRDPAKLSFGKPVALDVEQVRDLEQLHTYRNEFVHFKPETWNIRFGDLPRMLSIALMVIEHLTLMNCRAESFVGDQPARFDAVVPEIRVGLSRRWPLEGDRSAS